MFILEEKSNFTDEQVNQIMNIINAAAKENMQCQQEFLKSLCNTLDEKLGKFWYGSVSKCNAEHAVGGSIECCPKVGKYMSAISDLLDKHVILWKSLDDAISTVDSSTDIKGSPDNCDKKAEALAADFLSKYRNDHPYCTYGDIAAALQEHFKDLFGGMWQCLAGHSLQSSWAISTTEADDRVLLDQGQLQVLLFRPIPPQPNNQVDRTPAAVINETITQFQPTLIVPVEPDSTMDTLAVRATSSIVKGGGAAFNMQVLNQIFNYMDYHYRGWTDFACNNVLIPPFFTSRVLGPLLEEASGYVAMEKGTLPLVLGDCTEEKVLFQVHESICTLSPRPFALSRAKFNTMKKLFPEFSCLKKLPKTEAEITDIILVCPGRLVLIEVKSWTTFREENFQNSIFQLNKAADVINDMIRELKTKVPSAINSCLPVHKCLYLQCDQNLLPEDTEPQLSTNCILLIDNKTLLNFATFLDSLDSAPSLLSIHMLAMLVASINVVSSILFAKTFTTLNRQLFLKENYRRQQESIRKNTNKTNEKCTIKQIIDKVPQQATLYKQFMFLNPEQSLLWNGPFQQYIAGPFGTGKTILLQHRLLTCSENNENILVIVGIATVQQLYVEFFEQNRLNFKADIAWLFSDQCFSNADPTAWIICWPELYTILQRQGNEDESIVRSIDLAVRRLFPDSKLPVNVFMDEIYIDAACQDLRPVTHTLRSVSLHYSIHYCWIVDISNNFKAFQILYSDYWSPTTDPNAQHYKQSLLATVDKLNTATGLTFELQPMRTVERQTTTLFDYLKTLKFPTHTVGFPIIGHNVSGPSIRQPMDIVYQQADTMRAAYTGIYNAVVDAVKKWCVKDAEALKRLDPGKGNNDFHVAAVLYKYNGTLGQDKKLEEAMQYIAGMLQSVDKIPTTQTLSGCENALYFGRVATAYSWEWPCVACVLLHDRKSGQPVREINNRVSTAVGCTRAVLELLVVNVINEYSD